MPSFPLRRRRNRNRAEEPEETEQPEQEEPTTRERPRSNNIYGSTPITLDWGSATDSTILSDISAHTSPTESPDSHVNESPINDNYIWSDTRPMSRVESFSQSIRKITDGYRKHLLVKPTINIDNKHKHVFGIAYPMHGNNKAVAKYITIVARILKKVGIDVIILYSHGITVKQKLYIGNKSMFWINAELDVPTNKAILLEVRFTSKKDIKPALEIIDSLNPMSKRLKVKSFNAHYDDNIEYKQNKLKFDVYLWAIEESILLPKLNELKMGNPLEKRN